MVYEFNLTFGVRKADETNFIVFHTTDVLYSYDSKQLMLRFGSGYVIIVTENTLIIYYHNVAYYRYTVDHRCNSEMMNNFITTENENIQQDINKALQARSIPLSITYKKL